VRKPRDFDKSKFSNVSFQRIEKPYGHSPTDKVSFISWAAPVGFFIALEKSLLFSTIQL
jgi:hypothetical protein